MAPESRNSPLLDNVSLTRSMKMRIRGDRLGKERAFHVNGINKQFPWILASNKHFPWIRSRQYKESCREERLIHKTVVFQGSRSRREDTRRLVRKGASLSHLL
jgi:hypothetical protein